MKKHLLTFGLFALSALIGCTETGVDDQINDGGVAESAETLHFTAGVTTRVSAENDLAWELNDRIGISVSGDATNTNVEYKVAEIVIGNGTLESVGDALVVEDATTAKFFAYYPFVEGDGSFSVDLTSANKPLLRAAVTGAKDNNIALVFAHQYAKLVFNIEGIEPISDLTGATATLVGANATAKYDASAGAFSDEALADITAEVAVSEDVKTLGAVTMYVVPTALTSDASITITVDGEEYVKDIPEQTWDGGCQYGYNVKIGEETTVTPPPTVENMSYLEFVNDSGADTADDPAITKSDEEGSIARLLAQFRRCVATYDKGTKVMSIKYLDNDNSTIYPDGSEAALPEVTTVDGKPVFSEGGRDCDVMVYFPEYWYKYEPVGTNGKYYRYYIADTAQEGYIHVEESLVGAYKSYMYYGKYLHSCISAAPGYNKTFADFKAAAEARGEGYQLIDFNQHSTITLMLFAKYCKRDIPNEVLGRGSATPTANRALGATNNMGNNDSALTTSGYVTALGLEGVYGGFSEFMQGVTVDADNLWTITDYDGSTRTVQAATVQSYVQKLACSNGGYFDVVPVATGATKTTYGCGYHPNNTGDESYVYRSYNGTGVYAGLVYVGANIAADYKNTNLSSRLAFRGEIVVVE